MSLLLWITIHFVALAGLAVATAALGSLLVARLRTENRAESLALATAIGLGAAGTLLFALGLAGGLRRWILLPLAAIACAAAARRLLGSGAAAASKGTPPKGNESPRPRLAPALLVGAALAPAFVWGLYPPAAFDATVYHLPFARAFAASHRLVETPELLFTVFPQLVEALFAAMMVATGVDTAAHLVQWLAVAATALLLYGAGRRFYSARAGLWAAALWLAHPLVHYQAASGYVDAAFALFALVTAYAWELWHERGEWGWLLLAGAAAGFGAATKYHGLLWLLLFTLLTLVGARRGRRLRGAAALLAVACLVAGPWYLRSYVATGNPIHPFLAPMFEGGSASKIDRHLGLDDAAAPADLPLLALRRLGEVAARPVELARFAWQASFAPAAFDRQAALAPWPLLLTPLAAVFALRDRRLLRWLALVFLYAALWTTTQPRFQLPGAALLALAGAAGLEHLARRAGLVRRWLGRRGVAALLAAVMIAPGPLYATYKLLELGQPPPASALAREDFLDRRVAGHAAIRWLNEMHGASYTLYAARAPELTYYARGRFLGQARGPHRISRIRPLLGDAAALHRELRAIGVDYLLVAGEARPALARDESFARLFLRILGDDRFDLYELAPPAPADRPAGGRDG